MPIARASGAKEHCHQEQANNKHPWAQTPIPTRIWCLWSNTSGQRESFKRFARLGRTEDETLSSRGAYPSRCPPPLRTRSRTAAATCGAQLDLVVRAPLRSPYHKKARRPKEEDGRSPGLQRSHLEPLLSTHREAFVCGFVIMFVTCGGRTVLWQGTTITLQPHRQLARSGSTLARRCAWSIHPRSRASTARIHHAPAAAARALPL